MDKLRRIFQKGGVNSAGVGDSVVWVGDERLRGSLRWTSEGLFLGDRRLDPSSVRSLSLETDQSNVQSTSGSVVLRNGERWQCEIESLAKGKLSIHGSLPGARIIELSSVHSLQFGPFPPRSSKLVFRPGMLYRTVGSPVPGKIAWIKKDDLALDSPLGILPIPRSGLLAYVFPDSPVNPSSSGLDEVGLKDGSLFFGKVRIDSEKVFLERSDGGTLPVPWEKLRYLIRSGKDTFWLNGMASASKESHGPLGSDEGVLHGFWRAASLPFCSPGLAQDRLSYRIPRVFLEQDPLQTHLASLPNSEAGDLYPFRRRQGILQKKVGSGFHSREALHSVARRRRINRGC